jgi:hypothetical protein
LSDELDAAQKAAGMLTEVLGLTWNRHCRVPFFDYFQTVVRRDKMPPGESQRHGENSSYLAVGGIPDE